MTQENGKKGSKPRVSQTEHHNKQTQLKLEDHAESNFDFKFGLRKTQKKVWLKKVGQKECTEPGSF